MMPVLGMVVHCPCLEKWSHSFASSCFPHAREVLTLVGIGILTQKTQQGWIPVGNNGKMLVVGHPHCLTLEGATSIYTPAGEP